MSFASRFLSTARVAVWTGSRSANLPSSRYHCIPVISRAYATVPAAVATPEVKNTTPEEFKVASENPPPSGISDPTSDGRTDWSKSYHGLSEQAFSIEISEVLMAPINPLDIEIKPGMISAHLYWLVS